MPCDLGGGARDETSLEEKTVAVAEAREIVQPVRGDEERAALLSSAPESLGKPARSVGVEPLPGLVEEHAAQFRANEERRQAEELSRSA
jgi:hypothetical protein